MVTSPVGTTIGHRLNQVKISRRRSLAAVTAMISLTGFFWGSAVTAVHAEQGAPPQTLPIDDSNGTGNVFGPGSVNWVADQFDFDGWGPFAWGYYSPYDGHQPTWLEVVQLQNNLQYADCTLQWWHPGQIACSD